MAHSGDAISVSPAQNSTAVQKQSAGKGKGTAQKRGNKGNFSGEHLQWLASRLQEYLLVIGKNACTMKLAEIVNAYVQKFPWHNEPIPDEFRVLEDSDASAESAGLPVEDYEALKKKKGAYQKNLGSKETTVKNWILRNVSQAKQSSQAITPFIGLIKQMCNVGHPPRRMKDFKFYMCHVDYKEKVLTEFWKRWEVADLPRSKRLDFQCGVAQELFEQESEEVQQQIAQENTEAFAKKEEAYQQLMNGEKFAMDDLSRLGEEFGDHAQNIISSGETVGNNPRKFELWNVEEFTKNVIGHFMKFLLQTVPVELSESMAGESVVTQVVNRASEQLIAQNHQTFSGAVGISLHPLDDPNLIAMDDDVIPTGDKGQARGRKRAAAAKRKKTRKRTREPETDNSSPEHSDSDMDKETPSEPVRRSSRPKPIPTSIEAFKARIPKDWKAPSGLLEALKALEGARRKEEMKELLQRMEQSENDFYQYGQCLARERDIKVFKSKVPTTLEVPAVVIEALEGVASEDRRRGIKELLSRSWKETLADEESGQRASETVEGNSAPIDEENRAGDEATANSPNGECDGLESTLSNATNPDTNNGSESAPSNATNPDAPMAPEVPMPTALDVPAQTSTTTVDPTSTSSPTTTSHSDAQLSMTAQSISNEGPLENTGDDVVSKGQADWPKWLETAFDAMSEHEELENMKIWMQALTSWVTLERKYQWENPDGQNAFFMPTGRLSIVSVWSKERKKIQTSPPDKMEAANDFSRIWWTWQLLLNPDWRSRNAVGRVIADGIEVKEKDRWDVMKKLGQCGMLSVLLCLFYWFLKLETPEQQKDWEEALDDVHWVLEWMNKCIRASHGRKRVTDSPVEGDEPTCRLRRRQ
ncbi:hypothetical protein VKT23_011939 [Stygiomarasmius scandens]|uniref:Uncharacterized protein n=1 Tax=Marasmiellus scandens TaxID=2682957 RepID=A0ABR1J9Y9_9AGAR